MTIVVRIAGVLIAALASVAIAATPPFPDAATDQRFVFPRDHGAHPDFRTEWWYVTGWLQTADHEELGFQVTFFRSRLEGDDANPSRFAPRQLLFAHAALADPRVGHLEHDQRIARTGFGIAEASATDANVVLDGWRFERVADPAHDTPSESPAAGTLHFRTHVEGSRFALDLDLASTGPVLAEGADALRPGYSQKGPVPRDASRYYSVPQLKVSGTVRRIDGAGHRDVAVTGTAWLDREWSSAYLDPQASGWDWVGLNFDDGSALMGFRMRDKHGAKLWAGGARRFPDGRIERYAPGDIDFATLRSWSSPRSKATWPVQQAITIGGSPSITPLKIVVDPLMDDQELDSRASTGTIYWEGAVRVRAGDASGATIGNGYLEMTGYARPIRF
ncbi:MAG: carotenoid 1,2-hydratase [Burkholderiaceae bacterium]